MTYRELKKALLDMLDISPQALNQQCQKLKQEIPLTTEDATYIIAHRKGIKLDKYLDGETVARIRDMHLRMNATVSSVSKKDSKVIEKKTNKKRSVKIGSDTEYLDVILSNKKLNEAAEMAKIYPRLYVLENSIREFIQLAMESLYGKDWWNSQAAPKLVEKVNIRMSSDKKDSWHQRRGSHPLDYLDMIDLPPFVNKIQQFLVPTIIPSFEWLKQLVEEVYKSRCVICHMNPLEENNIKSVEVKFNQWQKQMNEKKDIINTIGLSKT